MTDIFSRKKRSEIMSRIKTRGNLATELRLIKILHENNITGWRRNRSVFGKPDFVFPEARLAVFIDGCFWHGCPLHSTLPKANHIFWKNKLAKNKKRDKVVVRTLKADNWHVLRIWQHELNKSKYVAKHIRSMLERNS